MQTNTHYCDSLYCNKRGLLKCKACGSAYYCSDVHQKLEWSVHQKFCKHPKRNVVVDGYQLCDTILKSNDRVHTFLTNKHFDRIEQSNTNIVIHSVEEEEEEQKCRIVSSAMAYTGSLEQNEDSVKAYWAIRSLTSTFTLNTTLYYLLQSYEAMGYQTLLFGNTEIELKDVKLVGTLLAPATNVHYSSKQEYNRVTVYPISVGGYRIDLSAGRYWIFDQKTRPLLVTEHHLFGAATGRLIGELKEEHLPKNMEKMYENPENVIDGASVYKFSAIHLGLFDTYCPERFKDVQARTQEDKLRALALITSDQFSNVVDKYMKKNDSLISLTVNTLGHCCTLPLDENGQVCEDLVEDTQKKKM